MADDQPLIGAEEIRALLTELGARLHERGIEGRLFLVGEAAMALAYSRTRITRDLDGVFEPKMIIYEEAAKLAEERGLPPDWLNDGVKGLMPDKKRPVEGSGIFSAPGIHVGVASAEYLFAMKAAAARQEVDADDLRTLMKVLGITTADDALALVERFYAPSRLSVKTQLLLEDLAEELGDGSSGR